MTKTTLITGCTTGIGLETARSLAIVGHNLILISRSEDKLKSLKNELLDLNKKIHVDYFVCDFENLRQVRDLGRIIEKSYPRLDVMINNAGIWESQEKKNEDGFEITWVVNYFAPFVLTAAIMPLLMRTANQYQDVRIINLSSEAHRFGHIDYNDFFKFSFRITYGSTKLANLLYTLKLARDLEMDHISVHAIHPGVVATGLWRRLPPFIQKITNRFMITPEKGAMTTVAVATMKTLPGTGLYWSNEKPAIMRKNNVSVQDQNQLYDFTKTLLAKYL